MIVLPPFQDVWVRDAVRSHDWWKLCLELWLICHHSCDLTSSRRYAGSPVFPHIPYGGSGTALGLDEVFFLIITIFFHISSVSKKQDMIKVHFTVHWFVFVHLNWVTQGNEAIRQFHTFTTVRLILHNVHPTCDALHNPKQNTTPWGNSFNCLISLMLKGLVQMLTWILKYTLSITMCW